VRVLILSDIHANWYALEAVLADAKGQYQSVVCCGDLVGYNPNPTQVLDWVKANCRSVIRGNHDKAVAGLESLEGFNEVAQAAARWTIDNLSNGELTYLRELAAGPRIETDFHLWHGSAIDEDEYVATVGEATPGFGNFELPLAFFGHTHLQGGFFSKYGNVGLIPAVRKQESEAVIDVEPDVLYMINPGSVGQPRDADPRAAYAIFDAERKLVILHRVDYPVAKTASEIRDAGLPEVLGLRLFHGL
jgi:predicted phosphodiesterase